jgi:hypothetical protein
MKKQLNKIVIVLIITYLILGLGIDRYKELKSNQNESFVEGLARENDKYSPSHLLSILFWPFYL